MTILVKEGKEEIQKLHDTLYTEVLAEELRNDIPFIPHITLGEFGKNPEEYDKALKEAEDLDIEIGCQVDKITLIKGDGVNPAEVIQEFTLL